MMEQKLNFNEIYLLISQKSSDPLFKALGVCCGSENAPRPYFLAHTKRIQSAFLLSQQKDAEPTAEQRKKYIALSLTGT